MTKFQQGQEDLMADFYAPPRKETREFSTKEDGFDENLLAAFNNTSSNCSPEIFKRVETSNPVAGNKMKVSDNVMKDVVTKAAKAAKDVTFGDLVVDDNVGLTWGPFTSLLEETTTFPTLESIDAILETFGGLCTLVLEGLMKFPEYDVELKCLMSAFLICYGGSWANVAGLIAAVETFGSIEVLKTAYSVGTRFITDPVEEVDMVTPEELQGCLKKLGLQIALLIAVVVSPSWAEICLSTAFAAKFTNLVPMKDILTFTLSSPDTPSAQLDDYLSLVDDSWFDLLSLFACNIVSLIVTGFFPRMSIAMYMCQCGVSFLAECASTKKAKLFAGEKLVEKFESFWKKNATQVWVWIFALVMGIWQAIYDYSGVFVTLSWLMFLHPVVSVCTALASK